MKKKAKPNMDKLPRLTKQFRDPLTKRIFTAELYLNIADGTRCWLVPLFVQSDPTSWIEVKKEGGEK